ncbi:LOW QUALITY PROTEIN: hypothetical protein Bca4012_022221 [Brassica carinata]
MDTNLVEMFRASLNWVTVILDAPSARVVLFGVRIQGYIIVEGLLGFVIVFPLSQKSYKPPQRPLTEQEIDELCPETLIPPITEDMRHEPPVLESAAGPHTTFDGKDVVNFASANYLGLIGHEKLLISKGMSLASDPESPIVFLKLEKSSGSAKEDLLLLEKMAARYTVHYSLQEDSLLVVSSKKSFLDKCRLPVGIKLFVSAGHSDTDLIKASDSLKASFS